MQSNRESLSKENLLPAEPLFRRLPENSLFPKLPPSEYVTEPGFEPSEQDDIIRVTLTQPEAYFDESGEESIRLSEQGSLESIDPEPDPATPKASGELEGILDADAILAEAAAFAKGAK